MARIRQGCVSTVGLGFWLQGLKGSAALSVDPGLSWAAAGEGPWRPGTAWKRFGPNIRICLYWADGPEASVHMCHRMFQGGGGSRDASVVRRPRETCVGCVC